MKRLKPFVLVFLSIILLSAIFSPSEKESGSSAFLKEESSSKEKSDFISNPKDSSPSSSPKTKTDTKSKEPAQTSKGKTETSQPKRIKATEAPPATVTEAVTIAETAYVPVTTTAPTSPAPAAPTSPPPVTPTSPPPLAPTVAATAYIPAVTEAQPQEELTIYNAPYIGNANSRKFHYASCSSVNDMAIYNKVPLGSREDAIALGYEPCKRCKP